MPNDGSFQGCWWGREDVIDPRRDPPACVRSHVVGLSSPEELRRWLEGDGGPDPAPCSPLRVRRVHLAPDHPILIRLPPP